MSDVRRTTTHNPASTRILSHEAGRHRSPSSDYQQPQSFAQLLTSRENVRPHSQQQQRYDQQTFSPRNATHTHPLLDDENITVYVQLPAHTSEFSCKFDPNARQSSVLSLNLPSASTDASVHPPILARPHHFQQTTPKTRYYGKVRSAEVTAQPVVTLPPSSNLLNFNSFSGSSPLHERPHHRHSSRQPQRIEQVSEPEATPQEIHRMSPVVRPVNRADLQRTTEAAAGKQRAKSIDTRLTSTATRTLSQRAGSVQHTLDNPRFKEKIADQQQPWEDKRHRALSQAGGTSLPKKDLIEDMNKKQDSAVGPINKQAVEPVLRKTFSASKPSPQHEAGTPASTTTTTAVALQLLRAAGIDTKLVEEALEAGAYESAADKDDGANEMKLAYEHLAEKSATPRRSRLESSSENKTTSSKSKHEQGRSSVKSPLAHLDAHTSAAPPVIAPSRRRRRASAQSVVRDVHLQPSSRHESPTKKTVTSKSTTVQPESSKTIARSQSRGSVRSGSILNTQQHDTIHEGVEHRQQHKSRDSAHSNKRQTADVEEHQQRPTHSKKKSQARLIRVGSVPMEASSLQDKQKSGSPGDKHRRHSAAPRQKSARKTEPRLDRKHSPASRSESTSPSTLRFSGSESAENGDAPFLSESEAQSANEAKLGRNKSNAPTQPAHNDTQNAQLASLLQQLQRRGVITIQSDYRNKSNSENDLSDQSRSQAITSHVNQRSSSGSSGSTVRRITRQASQGSEKTFRTTTRRDSSSSSSGDEHVPMPPRRGSRDESSQSRQEKTSSAKRKQEKSASTKLTSQVEHNTDELTRTKPRQQLMKEGVEWQSHMTSENQMLTQAVKLLEQLVGKKQPDYSPVHRENGRVVVDTSSALLEQLQQLVVGNSRSDAQTNIEHRNHQKSSPRNSVTDKRQTKHPEADDEEAIRRFGINSTSQSVIIHNDGPARVRDEATPTASRKKHQKAETKNYARRLQEEAVVQDHQQATKSGPSQSKAPKTKDIKDDAYTKRIAELKQEYLDITARNKAAAAAARDRTSRSRNFETVIDEQQRPLSPSVSNTTFDNNFYGDSQPELPPVKLIHAHCFTDYLSSKLDRELRDAEECHKRVRSNPVPAHVKLPLYTMMQKNEEQRKLERHEQSVEKLKNVQPFSFVQQTPPPSEPQMSSDVTADGQPPTTTTRRQLSHGKMSGREHQHACPRGARVMPPPPPVFRARPVPPDLFDNRARLQREERRRQDMSRERVARIEQIKRESSLPPNMERRGQAYFHGKTHTKSHLEMFKAPTHHPEIHTSVPDFEELHRHEEEKIEERKRAAAVRSTIPQPFELATDRRAKEKQQIFEESQQQLQQNQQRQYKPQLRRANSSLTSFSAINYPTARQFLAPPSILPRETWSTRMRRAHSQKRMMASLRGDVETRMRELTGKEKQILMRLKMHGKLDAANSNLDYQMQLNARRAERMRQIVQMREQSYEKQLAQMQYKVDEQRPFLFERQGQKTPQTQKQLVNKVVGAANTITNALQKSSQHQTLKTSRTFDTFAPQVSQNADSSSMLNMITDPTTAESRKHFVDSMNQKHGFQSSSSTVNDFSAPVEQTVDRRRFQTNADEEPTSTRPVTVRKYANRSEEREEEESNSLHSSRKSNRDQSSDEDDEKDDEDSVTYDSKRSAAHRNTVKPAGREQIDALDVSEVYSDGDGLSVASSDSSQISRK